MTEGDGFEYAPGSGRPDISPIKAFTYLYLRVTQAFRIDNGGSSSVLGLPGSLGVRVTVFHRGLEARVGHLVLAHLRGKQLFREGVSRRVTRRSWLICSRSG
jgi:hypothetical protein